MNHIIKYNAYLFSRGNRHLHKRFSSRYFTKSKLVRQTFLDYFLKTNCHSFVKSSPVVPFCDPTVPFVNAGMNQFKSVFLGTQTPKFTKVANSQKCVRIGGKHNDLDEVGLDGFHHTFFEMLGNWSFGEYFKKDACEMAWKLLTDVYNIDKRFLYVTYFGGDSSLNLKADDECRDIWRSIGVADTKIIPFGRKENFWEMGISGPCGPCTEIHFDHLGGAERPEFVNKGLHDLTELWNLVFIEFNMDANGIITSLPQKHIDTGMGFERLLAVLQNTTSNYDTDVFQPLFTAIHKICPNVEKYSGKFGESDWNYLNRDYRILADHARMITVSLSDGMIPEQNQKLRRIIRKTLAICANTFNKETTLLKELSAFIVDGLGPVYPEMERNFKQTQQMIEYEGEVYKTLRKNATKEWKQLTNQNPELDNLDVIEMPGLIAAFKDIKAGNLKQLSPEYGYKLYDTYGLDNTTINELCNALKIKCDMKQLIHKLELMKLRSKQNSLAHLVSYDMKEITKLPKTDDSFKYSYTKVGDLYQFEQLPVKVLLILNDKGAIVDKLGNLTECEIVLDKTNLYSEAGGQMSDFGSIDFPQGSFTIHSLKNIDGYLFHRGLFKQHPTETNGCLLTNHDGVLKLNEDIRFRNMCNHTCVHLLNASFKALKSVTCQKSSKVTHDYCNLDVSCFCEKLCLADVAKIEDRVNEVIASAVPVRVRHIDSQDMLSMDNVTVVPGEIYPETGIRLIDISHKDFLSREPCCGTHVLNTKDIGDMCIVGFRSLGRSTSSFHAVTGDRAKLARNNGLELLADIEHLQKNVNDNIDKPEVLEMAVTALRNRLTYDLDNNTVMPVLSKSKAKGMLDAISKQIKTDGRERLKEFIEMEMNNALITNKAISKSNKEYLIHNLRCSMMLENVSLQRATNLCQTVPVLVISYSDSIVKARCCVPQEMQNDKFSAELWLSVVTKVFKSTIIKSSGQDSKLVAQMRAKRINIPDWGSLMKESMESANSFAEENL